MANIVEAGGHIMTKVPKGAITAVRTETLRGFGPAKAMLLFPNFPVEVRIKIFRLAIEDTPDFMMGHTVEMVEVATPSRSSVHTVASRIPAIMQTCRESFAILSAEYGYHRGLTFARGSSRALVFRPAIDRFFLGVITDSGIAPHQIVRDSFSSGKELVRSVRHLQMNIGVLMRFPDWAMDNIHTMRLDTLELFGTFQVSSNTVSHDVKLLFKKSNTIQTMFGFRYPRIHPNFTNQFGVQKHGAAAMSDVFNVLNEHLERQRLLWLWHVLNCAVENFLGIFPETVTCSISYEQ